METFAVFDEKLCYGISKILKYKEIFVGEFLEEVELSCIF